MKELASLWNVQKLALLKPLWITSSKAMYDILNEISIFEKNHNSANNAIFNLFIFCEKIPHSSEIRGLRSTKCSSEMLQNLL